MSVTGTINSLGELLSGPDPTVEVSQPGGVRDKLRFRWMQLILPFP